MQKQIDVIQWQVVIMQTIIAPWTLFTDSGGSFFIYEPYRSSFIATVLIILCKHVPPKETSSN